jgi:mannitol/fructose-specific phosphotransferase system IIA component (Ntr-type)
MLFSADYIIPELKARERPDAIREMVTHLVCCGLISPEDQEDLLIAFMRREKQFSTGIGFGLATPVARFERIPEVVMAFGRSSAGVEFDSLDKQPANLILMFIVPARSPAHEREYMDVKFTFVKILMEQKTHGLLLRSSTAEKIFAVLKEHWPPSKRRSASA